MPDPHWHAYTYGGSTYTDGQIRRGAVPASYPPIEIKDWLTRPRDHIEGTFTEVEEAMSWLKIQLDLAPPVDAKSFPVDDRLDRARATLRQTAGNDVVFGYYTGSRMYVSRALIACPRPGMSCPERLS
ncbi:hypothetical protein [Streptomyces sp. NPDC052225]|uniref:hypothetical protein n=1 Tax=Streptomyces sp. NPDC052225 TaxID=3154949 RepID=UPI00343AC182